MSTAIEENKRLGEPMWLRSNPIGSPTSYEVYNILYKLHCSCTYMVRRPCWDAGRGIIVSNRDEWGITIHNMQATNTGVTLLDEYVPTLKDWYANDYQLWRYCIPFYSALGKIFDAQDANLCMIGVALDIKLNESDTSTVPPGVNMGVGTCDMEPLYYHKDIRIEDLRKKLWWLRTIYK